MNKSARTLTRCHQDSRFKNRSGALDRTLGDLEAARNLLNDIIESFAPAAPSRQTEPQPSQIIGE